METTLPPGTCDNIIIPEIKRVFKKEKINVKNLLFAYSYEKESCQARTITTH